MPATIGYQFKWHAPLDCPISWFVRPKQLIVPGRAERKMRKKRLPSDSRCLILAHFLLAPQVRSFFVTSLTWSYLFFLFICPSSFSITSKVICSFHTFHCLLIVTLLSLVSFYRQCWVWKSQDPQTSRLPLPKPPPFHQSVWAVCHYHQTRKRKR